MQADFEIAAIQAIHAEFPNAEGKGCFYHYSQAIWRKTHNLRLAVLYKEYPQVQQWIRRTAGLALLPADQVQNAWLEVMGATPVVPRAEDFNDYLVVNWVDARFPLQMWNHHNTMDPRTNNNLEGFHTRLNRNLPHNHPNIYRFIEVLRQIEKADKVKLSQIDFGAAQPSRKRVYREPDNRIQRLKEQLHRGIKTSLQFLDAIGHLLKLG